MYATSRLDGRGAASGANASWEGLRRQARVTEEQIEQQLSALSRLSGQLTYSYVGADPSAALQSKQKVADIEKLLDQLKEINEAMASHGGESRSFVRARHREIFLDLSQEFRRLRSTLGQAQDTAELLAGATGGDRWGAGADGAAPPGATAALLRERGMISSSMAAVDGVIGQAAAVAGSLSSQGSLLEGMGRKVVQVGHKLPVVNGILNAIRRKKSKDALILSAVAAVCIVLIFIYVTR
ncbi:unnamed protein product [Pedinophyceae sp. YPF-701]|nr:unnamed protein product [Pedinophyceae sp. YPF-701]